MRKCTKQAIYVIVAIVISMFMANSSTFTRTVHADVEFREDGSVKSVDGIHNLDYSMYDKNGNWKGAVWGKDLCEMYHTTDVTGAAEKFASSKGWVWVPNEYTGSQEQINSYIASKVGSNPTPAETKPAEQPALQAEEVKTEEKAEEAPKYAHGVYDGITDEALAAFSYFTHDGVAGSCYIQIAENAERCIMPGNVISMTAANSEYGEVQFVNENEEVQYKFVFPQVSAEKDFVMNLDPVFDETEEGLIIDFNDDNLYAKDLGFVVELHFRTEQPDTEYYVYLMEDENYVEFSKITSDSEGFAILSYREVQKYIISRDDLIAAAKEAQEQEQQKTAEIVEDKEETTEELVKEDVEPISEEKNTSEEHDNHNFMHVGISIIIAIAVISIIFIGMKKSKEKNQ